ncbi:MAG TPA: AraC family transcriptional regulator [Betaproteobacteria bacterium]|nr:AraC family transcriptional regulator [Betaproteobacteria bacterium]
MRKKKWLGFIFAFLLPIIVAFWWWGAFNNVNIRIEARGPYRLAYREETGDYAKLPDRQQQVLKMLHSQMVKTGAPTILLLNDPRVTRKQDLKAYVGYLVAPHVQVHAPLKIKMIPLRRALIAEVKAQPLLAPGKAYHALIKYLAENKQPFRLPTLEIYQDGVLTIEMNLQ